MAQNTGVCVCVCVCVCGGCRWQVSDPGVCSAVCGPGGAQQNVTCVQFQQGQESEVEPSLCPDPRPPDSVPCVVDVCPIGWESMAKVRGSKPEGLPWTNTQRWSKDRQDKWVKNRVT